MAEKVMCTSRIKIRPNMGGDKTVYVLYCSRAVIAEVKDSVMMLQNNVFVPLRDHTSKVLSKLLELSVQEKSRKEFANSALKVLDSWN